ncbi:TetR/AcrR family transcriptional regulator [Thermonema rossianum]|jgi:AcrR family transcriptional regulator|uniref:TetR/AcrR family transcriptional regulator n=1 Tax=Thermonema rossianum TaxID=55505 RepID=UPI0008FFCAC1|nr:TetR/AcrR family transcriptional regulator [Thermonema rossianum]
MSKNLSRREQAKQNRREAILKAAELVFFTKGFRQATMDDVAKRARLSKATLYSYFKTKDELFFTIAQKGNEILQKHLREAIEGHEKGVDKVRAIGYAYFDFATRYPDYYKVIAYFTSGDNFELDEDLEREMLRMDDILAECIEWGIQDGSIKKGVDPQVVSKCLWAMANGIMQLVYHKSSLLQKYLNIERERIMNTFFMLLEESLSTEGVLKKGQASGHSGESESQ